MENPLENDIVVGEVLKAEKFEESNKPEMMKLWIDLGDREVQSAAQLGYNHTTDEVEGLEVLCVTDLGEVRIAGFKSEVLTVGVPGKDGNPVLVAPEKDVPNGGSLY
ncbi:tRNA-binding protein [Candidatus Nanosalina sp. VS9-1]|uniref:tRNA-binding protein n=1 Tax=Candidatus Nanosalina sp. VS9-1 TaxID=3388566 RepID=UPI0039E008B3